MVALIGERAKGGAKRKALVRTQREATALIRRQGLMSPDELRTWRRERGLSVARAAELGGVHAGTWYRWEGDPRAAWWKPHAQHLPVLLRGIEQILAGARVPATTPYALKRWRSRWGLRRTHAAKFTNHSPSAWVAWDTGQWKAHAYVGPLLLGAEVAMRDAGLRPGMRTVAQVCRALKLTREGVRLLIEKKSAGPFPGAIMLSPPLWLIPREEVERATARS